jgi:hypothetical protein
MEEADRTTVDEDCEDGFSGLVFFTCEVTTLESGRLPVEASFEGPATRIVDGTLVMEDDFDEELVFLI